MGREIIPGRAKLKPFAPGVIATYPVGIKRIGFQSGKRDVVVMGQSVVGVQCLRFTLNVLCAQMQGRGAGRFGDLGIGGINSATGTPVDSLGVRRVKGRRQYHTVGKSSGMVGRGFAFWDQGVLGNCWHRCQTSCCQRCESDNPQKIIPGDRT